MSVVTNESLGAYTRTFRGNPSTAVSCQFVDEMWCGIRRVGKVNYLSFLHNTGHSFSSDFTKIVGTADVKKVWSFHGLVMVLVVQEDGTHRSMFVKLRPDNGFLVRWFTLMDNTEVTDCFEFCGFNGKHLVLMTDTYVQLIDAGSIDALSPFGTEEMPDTEVPRLNLSMLWDAFIPDGRAIYHRYPGAFPSVVSIGPPEHPRVVLLMKSHNRIIVLDETLEIERVVGWKVHPRRPTPVFFDVGDLTWWHTADHLDGSPSPFKNLVHFPTDQKVIDAICCRADGSIEAICTRLVKDPHNANAGIYVESINILTNERVVSQRVFSDTPKIINSFYVPASTTYSADPESPSICQETIPIVIQGTELKTGMAFTTALTLSRVPLRWIWILASIQTAHSTEKRWPFRANKRINRVKSVG